MSSKMLATLSTTYKGENKGAGLRIKQNVTVANNDPKTKQTEPYFFVRDIPIFGDVILAPMAGYSDIPHRALCRSFGSAMNYTEFISAEDIINGTRKTKHLLEFEPDEDPIVIQIFGNDPKIILSAAKKVEELKPTIIDINLGCSTRRVSGRGAGVGMMREPRLVVETFSMLTKNLYCPITGKIRLGWEDDQNYLEIARILEDCGASLIAVHARTKEQKYSGQVDWEAIAEIKQNVSVPVIGNGDITSPTDIDEMLDTTGCDGVMIGRGAIGNPWLFSRIHRDTLFWSECADVIGLHLDTMLNFYGHKGLILFRKYVKRYLNGLLPLHSYSKHLVTANSAVEFLDILEETVAHYGDITVKDLRFAGPSGLSPVQSYPETCTGDQNA